MLRQVGSVDEFVEEFEMLASQVSGITDEQYMGLFMGGLKEDIRLEAQTLEPQNRYKAVSMARNVKRKLIRTGVLKAPVRKQGNFMSTHLQGNYLVNGGKYYGAPMTRTIQNPQLQGQNDKSKELRKGDRAQNRGTRNLSYQELIERRAKGLCFKCGQNYSPMHQCPERDLKLLVWEQAEEVVAENQFITEPEKGEQDEWEMVCHVAEFKELHKQVCVR